MAFLYYNNCYPQSYGLGFYSHEVIQDKRTSLDLFPDKPLNFDDDFEISFDLSFLPGHKDYFGYIFRLIKDDTQNIDLIFDHDNPHFSVIVGEKLPNITFNIDSNYLYREWNHIRLKFDFKNDRFIFYAGGSSFSQNGIGLKKNHFFKIYFGASQYKQFKVTDVPPMKIRDVKIFRKEELVFHWPLNERNGVAGRELISKNNCIIINPIWIKSSHYDWKLEKSLTVKGYAGISFNPEKELLYITGSDSLFSFKPADNSFSATAYKSGRQSLLPGNQCIYSNFNKKLYSIYIDQKLVTAFDFGTRHWSKLFAPGPVTDYWQFNKFFSSPDTSFYIIGGYGHYQYRNSVFKYHIPTDSFQAVEILGDRLIPRYLAALGQNASGDTAYILGGYGSLSGQQIVNPQNLYDLVSFSTRTRKFKKLFELEKSKEEFVFANSLVIDQKSGSWFGLVFPNYKYNSDLQLIKGSLTHPSFTILGSKIPYSFHDINSFSDLFYCSRTNTFLAVTLLIDSSEHTQLKIYTLDGPPVADESSETILLASKKNSFYWILLLIPVVVIFWYARKRRLQKQLDFSLVDAQRPRPVDEVPAEQPDVSPVFNTVVDIPAVAFESQNALVTDPPVTDQKTSLPEHKEEAMASPEPALEAERTKPVKSSVFLFGEMQVFDKAGTDITKNFTPLIKELFLIILLYTLKKGRGISSEKLNEILWYDKPAQSARNNRSVNIAKLKNILDKIGDCILSKDTGYWKIEFNHDEITMDFYNYLNIVRYKDHLDKEKIIRLAHITQPGNFLTNTEYEWLDAFKSEISNEIIDTYLHYAASINITDDPEFLLKLANYIFYFDSVNEEAMIIKCKVFSYLGKHSLAKSTFDNFIKEYKQLYGEDFSLSFQSVIQE